jgi:hypothetical protein
VLCETELPYDETLVDERHRLRAEWLRHARLVAAAEPEARDELAAALAAIGLEPGDL